jgi:hypothetical protein
LQGKLKKLIIFITGLHNKPQGCDASVASAAGPFTTRGERERGERECEREKRRKKERRKVHDH